MTSNSLVQMFLSTKYGWGCYVSCLAFLASHPLDDGLISDAKKEMSARLVLLQLVSKLMACFPILSASDLGRISV